MNYVQLLFAQLAEESAEHAVEASKIVRFGMDSMHPVTKVDNISRLRKEFIDILGVYTALKNAGIDIGVDFSVDIETAKAIGEKLEKIKYYALVSESLGMCNY